MKTAKLFAEFLRGLYLAREYLTSQKGQYKDPDADDYLVYSWKSYCEEEIGISCQAANSWLNSNEATAKGLPLCNPSVPAGFAAALWWSKERKKIKSSALKSKSAQMQNPEPCQEYGTQSQGICTEAGGAE